MESRLVKKTLRQKLMAERKAIPSEVKKEMDDQISQTFLTSEAYKSCETLLTYVSTEDEVDTIQIIKTALSQGKKVAVPLVDRLTKTMTFYQIEALNDLVEGYKGILEPSPSLPSVEVNHHCLCLVPGLSFNALHYRIGYGGGFYDKFLSQSPIMTLGLCRSPFFDTVELPIDLHDQKVDWIITDNGFVV